MAWVSSPVSTVPHLRQCLSPDETEAPHLGQDPPASSETRVPQEAQKTSDSRVGAPQDGHAFIGPSISGGKRTFSGSHS
jgi:hypothetical protein